MLHTPIPARLVETDTETRFSPFTGILLAMGMSVALWGAIYAVCIVRF